MMTQRIPAQTVPAIFGEALVGCDQFYRAFFGEISGRIYLSDAGARSQSHAGLERMVGKAGKRPGQRAITTDGTAAMANIACPPIFSAIPLTRVGPIKLPIASAMRAAVNPVVLHPGNNLRLQKEITALTTMSAAP